MSVTNTATTLGLRAAAAATAAVVAVALPAVAAYDGSVSPVAAAGLPTLATSGTDGTVEQVRQLAQCGTTMYAVGRFSLIKQGGTTWPRTNVFSFDATTGTVTPWRPDVNGQVNSVAVSPDCSTAYLGGSFTAVNGTPALNIAAVSTTTGSLIKTFARHATAQVNTVALSGTHLLVGGRFTTINGSSRKYLVSLDSATGRDDGYVHLNISGHYAYTDHNGNPSRPNATQVYNFAMSPDGRKLLAMGTFTSVGGQPRRQIVMLDLLAKRAPVDAWYSPEFDQFCHIVEPFYTQDASWSPDMSTVYVATTGYKPADGPGYNPLEPRAGLCDAAVAFPSGASGTQTHLWINYTGCDSLYATAADATTVYVGGHERWADNPLGCDTYLQEGASRVAAPGMAGLDALTGSVFTSPVDPTVGEYSRGRGLGADDMLVTTAGLWIASDNAQNTDGCGKTPSGAVAHGHSGICFLPYPSS